MKKSLKILGVVIIVLPIFFYVQFRPAKQISWGLNYSILQAEFLGLDWKKNYLEVLKDFRPRVLRIPVYWQRIEPKEGQFDFADYDYLLEESQKAGAKVILVLGRKQPRWPECHEPQWVKNLEFRMQNEELLKYISEAVLRYKDWETVSAWQIENEPFFEYGPDCPKIVKDFYRQELALVKSLDSRPIIVTDSGEKGAWLPVAFSGGEIFGSTMYRKVYHHLKKKYIQYPVPPALYRFKAGAVKTFSGVRRFIGVELQAEPWFVTNPYKTPWAIQEQLMNPQIFSEYVDYASRVGFAESYLWGVEWWYWAKREGHPEMWEAAKALFQKQ